MSEPSTSTRPVTPPPRITSGPNLPRTPDNQRQIELNRLRAKAAQRDREEASSSSNALNSNRKRPLANPGITTSPTAGTSSSSSKPLKRDSRLGNYFEYDLSKMVNSKGGFLVEERAEVDEELKRKEKERERQRALQSIEPTIYLDPALNPKCRECGTVDIDQTFLQVFKCTVCKKCQNEKPELYSLLTKTECKDDYLLTDQNTAELKDAELLPHLLKANPHKSTYANMMLFLRYQVEEFAWKKWGSPEALDAEYEKRVAEKKKKKDKKFEQSLKDLRKRTKESVWQKRKDAEHRHSFGPLERFPDGSSKQVCHECGFTVEVEHEQISTSLEVERLDVNLFRSKSLWLPARARGVFGGQVISQALVSATNSVDPAYALHSMHCYFLLSASPSTPIIYSVERIRSGKSYATRSVKAIQNGQIIFMMLCSFQKPEPWQPAHHWPMPSGVKSPEECELQEERSRSPIALKVAAEHDTSKDGIVRYMYWMKARSIPKYETPFQKCILAYASDLHFIGTASRVIGLKRTGKGIDKVAMMSTLDHTLWFYNNDFDFGEWALYVVDCPTAGSGRAVVNGRIYTRDGKLIAVAAQEGVMRADVRGPEEETKVHPKL
ncbi:thioesterase-like superfamily-domain-containing protein [Coprinopsis sp. MPI-PUGE-AT-0042]|nr:thioesterase-like superfamily-domain-containing protein [Coprinopsis sp. MPI-PUGE-AT-0042]